MVILLRIPLITTRGPSRQTFLDPKRTASGFGCSGFWFQNPHPAILASQELGALTPEPLPLLSSRVQGV